MYEECDRIYTHTTLTYWFSLKDWMNFGVNSVDGGACLTSVVEVVDVLWTGNGHKLARRPLWPANNAIPLWQAETICWHKKRQQWWHLKVEPWTICVASVLALHLALSDSRRACAQGQEQEEEVAECSQGFRSSPFPFRCSLSLALSPWHALVCSFVCIHHLTPHTGTHLHYWFYRATHILTVLLECFYSAVH